MVSDFFHPNTGGVETHIYQLSQCLMELGHTIVILTHSYDTRKYTGVQYLTNGLKVYYIPRLPVYQQATLPTIFGEFSTLRRILLAERIDLVHAHQAFSTLGHESLLHARTMRYPVIFTDHSLFGFADPASILVNKTLKFTLADVQAVICVSHTSKENTVLRACIPPQRVYVIPNAVEASLFQPVKREKVEVTNGHERDASITIVVMSRLVYRKGIDLLAAVLPEVCHRHPQVRFLIGGDGPKRALLEKVVEEEGLRERVSFVGLVAHNQVQDLMSQGQIFLNCSLTEAFCVALIEAAAVGLLVVSTNVGGVPEVLPDDMMILAEPSPDSILMAVEKAIERLRNNDVNDPQRQHDAVSQMYSWRVIAGRTERVYFDAIDRCSKVNSMQESLRRYYRCGKWFGKICCCIAIVDWMYWKWLTWLEPANSVKHSLDFPSVHSASNA